MKRLVVALVFVAAVAGALVLTVGGGTGGDEPGPVVPAVSLPRLDGSGDFELASLASTERPTLLWFWAPWCSVCNSEAPTIEALALEAGDALDVVAIGGRDDLENGPAFVERHGLRSPTVLFDESMAVWREYRIPGQPGAILLDTDGRERGRWLGAFDTDLALEAAKGLKS
jgi:thiol-disulfide isomerase/thioredoxin